MNYDYYNLPDDPRRANAECQDTPRCTCERLGIDINAAEEFHGIPSFDHAANDGFTCTIQVEVKNLGTAETVCAAWRESGLTAEYEQDGDEFICYGALTDLKALREAGL